MARLTKTFYRIVFELVSPLSIGSGLNNETDSDIITNSLGLPYVPGTAIAGILRSLLSESDKKEVFGDSLSESSKSLAESSVITYDADMLEPSKGFVYKRDMVALDDYKVAKDGAKFDFQILEPGVMFVTYLEVNITDEKDVTPKVEELLQHWQNFGLSFGSKTMRGYGLTQVQSIQKATLSDWHNFDVYDANDKEWQNFDLKHEANYQDVCLITLDLKQDSALSIREYSAEPNMPDYMQMRLKSGSKDAVIPGTSWAGAFRAQMKKLGLGEKELEEIFGTVKAGKANVSHRSRVYFSESYINGGEDKVITRNAIDRFTCGTIDGALYTEQTHYGGTTRLTIRCDKEKIQQESFAKFAKYLASAILDLNAGYMAIGGLTSVGRGLFKVEKLEVNGKETPLAYREMIEAIMEE